VLSVASALGFVNVGVASAVERGLSLTCQRSDSAAERYTLGTYIGAINEQDPPKYPRSTGSTTAITSSSSRLARP
jgi:hypothetical protein